ncbi:hypothetical protein FO519_004838 [Halicephalobus sp. NKZ332]|nr:hypothetical protein FO519_004838 [Halicephalobus sp. NKZ332]
MHPRKGRKKYEVTPEGRSLLTVIYQPDESLPPPRTLEEAMAQSPKLKEYFRDMSYRSKKFICKHLGLPPPYRKPYTRKQKTIVSLYINSEFNHVLGVSKLVFIRLEVLVIIMNRISAYILIAICVVNVLAQSVDEASDEALDGFEMFEKRAPLDRTSLVRFGKRAPLDRTSLVRFGKRAPLDRTSLVRFGKRAPLDRTSLVRFGKRAPLDRTSLVRFGKRASYDFE